MKITLFIGGLSGGGAERVACNLANHLAANGNEVEILTMSDAKDSYGLDGRVGCATLLHEAERKNTIYNTVVRAFRLYRYLCKKNDIDAYVVMLPATILMLMMMRFATKAKVILSERNNPSDYAKWMQKLLKTVTGRADGVVFQTTVVERWYAPSMKKAIGRVIPNAINPAFLRPVYIGQREKTIVAAGRLNKQKNFQLLIRSFAKIAPLFPEHKLIIYGKGELLEELRSLAGTLGVGDRVEFPGYVANMPERLEKASMFVLSSDYEGMPNALMEAMALGLPCVSTDCGGGGARFLVKDGENGFLVPQKDEEALAIAMQKILSDEALAAKLGNVARKLQETLAPEKIYGEWESFIKQIAERN